MTQPKRLRVHALYEHGPDQQPYSTAMIRLMRPLTHRSNRPFVDATFGMRYVGQSIDALVVDRLWHPHVDMPMMEALISRARKAGAAIIHAVDDNFLDLPLDRAEWATPAQVRVLHRLVREADGIMVSTDPLARRLARINPNVAVVPNALDERLLTQPVDPLMPQGWPAEQMTADGSGWESSSSCTDDDDAIVIGYMGTYTHDADLMLVLDALHEVCERHAGQIVFQLLGVLGEPESLGPLADLPLERVVLGPEQSLYTRFMPWFAQHCPWDIGIAPLKDTPFTRCKSDIKHLDYSAAGVAGIYSRVPAYESSVRHGETGLLADNRKAAWVAALEAMIGDARLRRSISKRAASTLMNQRTLATQGYRWSEALHRLATKSRREAAQVETSQSGTALAGVEAEESRVGMWIEGLSSAEQVDPRAPRAERLPKRLNILYEYGHGGDMRPLASGHLRLIRPFQHPKVRDAFDIRWSTRFDEHNVDAVILDRLWRPDIAQPQVDGLLAAVRRMNAQLILALDDNLLDLRAERADWPTEEHENILRWLLRESDGVLVSSVPLAERLAGMNDNIAILPNALDERLLGRPTPAPMDGPFGRRPITIGYMGTPTHDDDLRMILPALREIAERFPEKVLFEFIGVMRQRSTREALTGLPVRFASPRPEEQEYPLFMPWYTHRKAWDIAIAPLRDTPFRRCKSDVKFLDACALGAATVCSDVAAYSGTVKHEETGLLVRNTPEDWVDALSRLVADAELRSAIGRAGRRYLYAERTLAASGHRWTEAIDSLLKG